MNAVTVEYALAFLTALLNNSATLSAAISKLQTEGRTSFTPEEWAEITGARDAALAKLDADIAKGATP